MFSQPKPDQVRGRVLSAERCEPQCKCRTQLFSADVLATPPRSVSSSQGDRTDQTAIEVIPRFMICCDESLVDKAAAGKLADGCWLCDRTERRWERMCVIDDQGRPLASQNTDVAAGGKSSRGRAESTAEGDLWRRREGGSSDITAMG